jgi:hypothetical protein
MDAAAEQAERDGVSRARVLANWLELGWRAARQDGLAMAYDDYYAEPEPEEDRVPAQIRRERAARHDQRWD